MPQVFKRLVFAFISSVVLASLPGLGAAQDAAAGGGSSTGAPKSLEDSVVKVFSTMRQPDLARPWTKQSPQDATGSGVIIEGHYILTNAHVVAYATQIEVQANQSGDKLPASVVAIATGIDLALLKLDDDSFFDKRAPLSCAAQMPSVKDTVMALGYPTGGANLSVTKGIISRIEFANYSALTSGLRIQIDAAINPGNSGGAAVVGTKLIGITFSTLVGSGVQSIGYIIPCEEISIFLQKAEHNLPYSKPAMYDELQTLENPALRPYLKLDKSVDGIIVHAPYSPLGQQSPLREWDILTRIGDSHIDDQGMVNLPSGLRVHFRYLVQKLVKDGAVPVTVVRDGKTLSIALPVSDPHTMLIPDLAGGYPSYFVYGPLVFSPATQQFIGQRGNNLGAAVFLGSPLVSRFGDVPAFPGEQLVIVSSPFFPHKLARNYSNPAGQVVKSINGVAVKNMAHLVALLRDATDDNIVIAFQQRGAETLVFPRKEMLQATDDLLNDNGIRLQGSADTLAVWNAKPN